MTPATDSEKQRLPWVMVSGGFREQAGQDKPNAAVADFLLARGTPVHLVAHHFAPRFVQHERCTIYRAARPANSDLLGVFRLRRLGRAVAKQVTAAHPGARVLVNGGCCSWGDINWVHFVHSAWRPSRRGMPLPARLKDAVGGVIFRSQEREAIRRARLVIADSNATRREIIGRLAVEPFKVRTVYYGSEPTWIPPAPSQRAAARTWLGIPTERPLVAFVGGFGTDERKGFDTVWRAWQHLVDQGDWDVDLIAAGGGRSLPMWKDRVRQSPLADRVRLIGFTDRVYDVLAAADILVSPARYEPYGLNVQEAICMGLPALVSGTAGVAEEYPAELADMILPDPNDWQDLAARLRRWREQRDSWRQRIQPLGERLRTHTLAAMACELVELVEGEDAGG